MNRPRYRMMYDDSLCSPPDESDRAHLHALTTALERALDGTDLQAVVAAARALRQADHAVRDRIGAIRFGGSIRASSAMAEAFSVVCALGLAPADLLSARREGEVTNFVFRNGVVGFTRANATAPYLELIRETPGVDLWHTVEVAPAVMTALDLIASKS